MACYYIVISSTHLSNGHFRNIKGVFRGPLCRNGNLDYAGKEKSLTKALEDLKANFYCQLCDKQYYKHQEFDNHINSYDHAHKQRLKELKQREFARNVASKLRKDEHKQERARRRLHKLAEQKREVQRCAPGSGPMFKSTTVAVESFSTSCFIEKEDKQKVAGQETESHILWPYRGKAKKQTLRRKIAFSFSFPKRASLKLEPSAAVFWDRAEEKKLIKYDAEMMTHQNTSTKSSLNDAMPSSDLCAFLLYSENTSVSPVKHFTTAPESSNLSLDSEEDIRSENKVEIGEDVSAVSVSAVKSTSCDFSINHKHSACLTALTQPFTSVVGRDAKTIFQWPSEMVCFTKTEPSISFSCNPLHFDFTCSQFRKLPDDVHNKHHKQSSFISGKSPQTSSSSSSSSSSEISTAKVTCNTGKQIRKCHLHSGAARSNDKRLKDWGRVSKRTEDKIHIRDRRHYRNQHKKRQKRRSRRRKMMEEEEEEVEEAPSKPEQRANMKKQIKSHKPEGIERRFRGCAAQQERPLKKSKQSTENPAENNGAVSSAGDENVLDNSGGTNNVPALGQTTITLDNTHRLRVLPPAGETSATDYSSSTIPKKRQRNSRSEEEDDDWSDLTQCGDDDEDDLCLNHRRKRQKLDQSPSERLTDERYLYVLNGSGGREEVKSTPIKILSSKSPRDSEEHDTAAGEINPQTSPGQQHEHKNHLPKVQSVHAVSVEQSELECKKCGITSQVKRKVHHDKSCQHTPPPPPPPPTCQHLDEEQHNCAIRSQFNPMLRFTSQFSGVERRGLLQGHAHKQLLHQKVFSAKLRSTLPISSPILHPVHLPSALPSIHHSAFLSTQPSLFTQVLPFTRLPLVPEITPFIPSSQVSIMAPPTIHTTAVTFHTLPRPQVFRSLLHPPAPFPPLLPPHTAVIPIQPLF